MKARLSAQSLKPTSSSLLRTTRFCENTVKSDGLSSECWTLGPEFAVAKINKWFTPAEILQQATSKGGELLAMSGPKNPYPGKLGVIEEGAYADILLINGDPLKDISILTKPDENLALIMKDGKIYKNTIQ